MTLWFALAIAAAALLAGFVAMILPTQSRFCGDHRPAAADRGDSGGAGAGSGVSDGSPGGCDGKSSCC